VILFKQMDQNFGTGIAKKWITDWEKKDSRWSYMTTRYKNLTDTEVKKLSLRLTTREKFTPFVHAKLWNAHSRLQIIPSITRLIMKLFFKRLTLVLEPSVATSNHK